MLEKRNVYVCDVCASESEFPMVEFLGIHVCSFCEEMDVMRDIYLYGNVKDRLPDSYDIPDNTPVYLKGEIFSILGDVNATSKNESIKLILDFSLQRPDDSSYESLFLKEYLSLPVEKRVNVLNELSNFLSKEKSITKINLRDLSRYAIDVYTYLLMTGKQFTDLPQSNSKEQTNFSC